MAGVCPARVGVFGAGAVGGYLGILLASAGVEVALLGRRRVLRCDGPLRAVLDGGHIRTPRAAVTICDEAAGLSSCSVVLVTVKSKDTAEAGRQLADVLPERTPVISFQNGLHNVETLTRFLGRDRVKAGVVTFNVVRAARSFEKASEGKLFVEDSGDDVVSGLASALTEAGESVSMTRQVDRVARGKLLVNLNNGVCAATGLPISAMLRDPIARVCFSRCLSEGLMVMRRASLAYSSPVPLPLSAVSLALRLPNAVFLPLARRITEVHPDAVSSTLQDLLSGRPTEIDELNGEIVRIGAAVGTSCPANSAVVSAVDELAAQACAGESPGFLSPERLRRSIEGRT